MIYRGGNDRVTNSIIPLLLNVYVGYLVIVSQIKSINMNSEIGYQKDFGL